MKDSARLSVGVLLVAALFLPQGVRAIGITVDESSFVKSDVVVTISGQSDTNDASNLSFPQPTSAAYSGAAASADWSYENNDTWAVFKADALTASAITGLATAENIADLSFTLTEEVKYSIAGSVHASGQVGQAITVSVYFKGADGTLVDIDETVPYIPFLTTIILDEIPASASDLIVGVLPAGDYDLEFSMGVANPATVGSNSITGSFSIILGEPPEKLIGGAPVEGLEDWYLSDWFGYYNTTFDPWLFHGEHGFIYRWPESTNQQTYIYDDAMKAWWFTREVDYPSVYVWDPPADKGGTQIASAWVWYEKGTKSPRVFYVLAGPDAGKTLTFDP